MLDGVKVELHVLDVKDTDPDIIQAHLDRCMVSMQCSSLILGGVSSLCDSSCLNSLLRKFCLKY